MIRWAAPLLAIALGTACVKRAYPPTPSADTLVSIRGETQAMLRARILATWNRWQGGAPGPTPYNGRAWLLSPETLNTVRAVADDDPIYGYLYGYLLQEHVDSQTAAIDRQILDWRAQTHTHTGASDSLPQTLPPELVEALHRRHDVVAATSRNLGFGDHAHLSSAVQHFDVKAQAALARRVLRQSEALYLALMRQLGAQGREARELAAIDDLVPALQTYFPKGGAHAAATGTLRDLGFSSRGITIDTTDRPAKNPRPATFPVSVPDDIRVSIKPRGGSRDYLDLMHELGHALQFAHTGDVELEQQLLGDPTSAEASAFVFDGLLTNRRWLQTYLGMPAEAARRFQSAALFRQLFMIRRHAATLLFELQHHTAHASAADFATTMARAYGAPISATNGYLLPNDPFFYSAAYLRGWLLAAQIRADLWQRFGPTWWQDPAAGQHLTDLWRPGQARSSEEWPQGPLTANELLTQTAQALID